MVSDTGSADWTTKPPREWIFAPKRKVLPEVLQRCGQVSDDLIRYAAAALQRLEVIDRDYPELPEPP